MSLFQLTNQYKALMQKIDDNPDLDPEVVADTVSSIEKACTTSTTTFGLLLRT